jgi:hypothetical protein
MNRLERSIHALSDDALLAHVADLVGRSRRVEAELIAHLAEVDARRLYRREACASMHAYATERLHLSEAEAYLRITIARLSRRIPAVLGMLADGRLHLSGLAKLAPHLTGPDAEDLLARAVFRSKREIQVLIAEVAPQPDAPSSIRRLPVGAAAPPPGAHDSAARDSAARDSAARDSAARDSAASALQVAAPARSVATPAGSVVPTASDVSPADRCLTTRAVGAPDVIVPTAPARYKVQFTAGSELHDKITRAQALLRREVPGGDLAAVIDRAMTLLLRELERARFGATPAPRKEASESDPTPSSRRIPDPIRRAVWQRDGGQCTFQDRKGRRCSARERLEFHHVVPFGRGGDHSESNVRILCSVHNAYQSELDYGPALIAARRTGAALDGAAAARPADRNPPPPTPRPRSAAPPAAPPIQGPSLSGDP